MYVDPFGSPTVEPCHCTISASDNDLDQRLISNTRDCFQCKVIKSFNPRTGWFVAPAEGATAGFGVTCLRCRNSKYLNVISSSPLLRTQCVARPNPDSSSLVAHRGFNAGDPSDLSNDFGRELREPFVCTRPSGADKYSYVSEQQSAVLEPIRTILAQANGSGASPSGRAYQDCSCIRNAKINSCEWKVETFDATNPVIVAKGLSAGPYTVLRSINCGQKRYFWDPNTYFYHTQEKIMYQGKCVGYTNCPATHSKVGYARDERVCADPTFCTVDENGIGLTSLTITIDGTTTNTEIPCSCPSGVHSCYWAANNSHAEVWTDTSGVISLLCKSGLSLLSSTGECLETCPSGFVSQEMSVGSWCIQPGAAPGGFVTASNHSFTNTSVDDRNSDFGYAWALGIGFVVAMFLMIVATVRYRRRSQQVSGIITVSPIINQRIDRNSAITVQTTF